jgi:hypothetical protein
MKLDMLTLTLVAYASLSSFTASASREQTTPTAEIAFALNVRSFGALGDGSADDTDAFQKALDSAGRQGGAQVQVPAGQYMIRRHLSVPPHVTLAGIAEAPPRSHNKGSTLLAVEGKGNPEGTPFVTLHEDATVKGIQVFYPEQTTSPVCAYPWCIRGIGDNCSILNVLLVNPYQAVDLGSRYPAGRHYINGLNAQPLKTGLFIDKCFDVGRVENVHFWPFWSGEVMDYTTSNATAFIIGRTDWEYMTNCFAIAYKTGYHFVERADGPGNAVLTQCGSDIGPLAVKVDSVQEHAGVSFLNGQFMAGVEVAETNRGPVKFTACGFWGVQDVTDSHVRVRGHGHVSLSNCHFVWWGWRNPEAPCILAESGSLSVNACDFLDEDPQKNHVRLLDDVLSAQVIGNHFRTPPRIENRSEGDVAIAQNVGGKGSRLVRAMERFDADGIARAWRQRMEYARLTDYPVELRLAAAVLLGDSYRTLRTQLLQSVAETSCPPSLATFPARAEDELALDSGVTTTRPCITATYTRQALNVDGVLDDAAWLAAPAVHLGGTGDDTEARVVWNNDALYLGFKVHEPNMKGVRAQEKAHDGPIWTDDSIEFFLAPRRSVHRYLQLIVNSAGALYDGVGNMRSTSASAWNTRAQVATSIGKNGWTAEMRLTWKDIDRRAPRNGDTWTADVRRWRYAAGTTQYIIWSDAPKGGATHNAEAFGWLRFEGRPAIRTDYEERSSRRPAPADFMW